MLSTFTKILSILILCTSLCFGQHPVNPNTQIGGPLQSTNQMLPGVSATSNGVVTMPNVLSNFSLMVFPEWYGAVGNGIHDDTAAFTAAFTAAHTLGACVHINAGYHYLVKGQVNVASGTAGVQQNYSCMKGEGRGSIINCSPTVANTNCFVILNGSNSEISNLSIMSNSNVNSSIDVTVTPTTNSTEDVLLSNLFITGGVHHVILGPDNTGDVSHVNISQVRFTGSSSYSIVVGNGQQGNVLANSCHQCTIDTSGGAVDWNGGGFAWIDGGTDENTACDFEETQMPDQQIVVKGVRSEGSPCFWTTSGGNGTGGIGGVSFEDDSWFASNSPATYAIVHQTSQPLTIKNSRFINASSTVNFNIGNQVSNPTPIIFENIGLTNNNFLSSLQSWSVNPNIILFSTGDYYIDNTFVMLPGSKSTFGFGGSFNKTLCKGTIPLSNTGNSNVNTLATCVIPGGLMGPNTQIGVEAFVAGCTALNTPVKTTCTTANTSTTKLRISFGAIGTSTTAAATNFGWQRTIISNQNATNVQYEDTVQSNGGSSFNNTSGNGTVDTTSNVNLVFTLQNTNTTDIYFITQYIVTFINP